MPREKEGCPVPDKERGLRRKQAETPTPQTSSLQAARRHESIYCLSHRVRGTWRGNPSQLANSPPEEHTMSRGSPSDDLGLPGGLPLFTPQDVTLAAPLAPWSHTIQGALLGLCPAAPRLGLQGVKPIANHLEDAPRQCKWNLWRASSFSWLTCSPVFHKDLSVTAQGRLSPGGSCVPSHPRSWAPCPAPQTLRGWFGTYTQAGASQQTRSCPSFSLLWSHAQYGFLVSNATS